MPTYQYQCTECEEALEAVQKFTDEALTECPSCHGRLRKVFSAVGIVFKGSGFYRNDSRSSSNGSSASSGEKNGKAAGSGKDSGSSSGSGSADSGSSSGSSSSSSSSSASTTPSGAGLK